MKVLFTVILAFALSATKSSAAESRATWRAGEDVVESFLTSLVSPRRSDYRVGIVNGTHGYALRVSRKDATAVVEVVHGQNNGRFWLIADAQRQLADPETTDLRFRIVRKKVELSNCPELAATILAFYSNLEAALSVPIRLNSPPPGPPSGPAITDTISYSVQIATEGSVITIRPIGGYRPPLQGSIQQLEAVAMRCALAVEGIQDVSG